MPQNIKKSDGKIITVSGLVDPSTVGITLPHEHILCDCTCRWKAPTFLDPVTSRKQANKKVSSADQFTLAMSESGTVDNLLLDDVETAIEELKLFRNSGGETIVDLSCIGLGTDPIGLLAVSKASGVNLICSTGYYIQLSHPNYVNSMSAEDIANRMVADIDEGIGNTQIRAGVIGEIGISPTLQDSEEKVLRAAVQAQRKTGAGVSIHYSFRSSGTKLDQTLSLLEIAEKEGANLRRLVMCHQDDSADSTMNLDNHIKIAERGAFVEYDLFGREGQMRFGDSIIHMPLDLTRVRSIRSLIELGFTNNILISHDICRKHQLRRYGGYGYSHILSNILPVMRAEGIASDQIRTILVENPKRLLTIDSA
jgi:phosphotriesterase-related protein